MTKQLQQKLVGTSLLIICMLVLKLCSSGGTFEDQDITSVALIAALGLWMIFTKKIVIH